MMNKTLILLISFFFISVFNTLGQRDTIKPLYYPYKLTSNKKLLKYSQELSLLVDICDHSRSLKAFENYKKIFKDAPEAIKDTALLIFIRFHKAPYDYFECPDSKTYSDFYDENGVPIDSLLENVNKSLNKFGRKLDILSHYDIFSLHLPGYTYNLFHDQVRKEIKLFLKIFSLKDSLHYTYCSSEDCNEYIEIEEEIVLLSEYYVKNYKFMRHVINEDYYTHLINFCLGEIYYIDGYERGFGKDFSKFHICDKKLKETYSRFAIENPNSKATWFIKKLNQVTSPEKNIDKKELFELLMKQSCFGKTQNDCECNPDFFTYDNFQTNVEAIIKCVASGEVNDLEE